MPKLYNKPLTLALPRVIQEDRLSAMVNWKASCLGALAVAFLNTLVSIQGPETTTRGLNRSSIIIKKMTLTAKTIVRNISINCDGLELMSVFKALLFKFK